MRTILALALALILLCGAVAAAEALPYDELTGELQNGSRAVPCTIVLPKGEGPFPLVVMNHGHGGSRQENTGFPGIAKALAEKGIASIRMDFAGCGDSKAPFTENYLSNMISDSNLCLEYALNSFPIDKERLGIFGYSMGGRIALMVAGGGESPYKAMALLAPAAENGAGVMAMMMGGAEGFADMEKKANEAAEGYVEYTTIYGQVQQLSKSWFQEMRESNPIDGVKFSGPALVLRGDKDEVISQVTCDGAIDALKAAGSETEFILVPEADHGYGFYSDQPDVTKTVEEGIADFFAKAL